MPQSSLLFFEVSSLPLSLKPFFLRFSLLPFVFFPFFLVTILSCKDVLPTVFPLCIFGYLYSFHICFRCVPMYTPLCWRSPKLQLTFLEVPSFIPSFLSCPVLSCPLLPRLLASLVSLSFLSLSLSLRACVFVFLSKHFPHDAEIHEQNLPVKTFLP